mgnify:CR=1 FL=1
MYEDDVKPLVEEAEPTTEPQVEQTESAIAEPVEQNAEEIIEKTFEKTMVPLSALQKERQKKKEIELELQWERQKNAEKAQQPPEEENNSRYESATKEDLTQSQEATIRAIEERLWIKNNPEKVEKINEYLPQFLKQRPNLASAINLASNRYEEAYTLMEALTPRQQEQLKVAVKPKKEAPNAPGVVPKAAALNQAVDLMSMTDAEFVVWRNSQKKRR